MKKRNVKELPSTHTLQKKHSIFSFILISSFLAWGDLHAQIIAKPVSPLLTGHYMPGFMNIRDFADPAPVSGILVLDYNAYQTGNQFFGKDGKQVTQIKGPLGAPVNLNLDVNGYSNTPMVLWASKGKVLGATYYGGATISFVTANPNLAYSRIGFVDSAHQSGNINANVSGFSDLGLMPIYLSWGLKNFDLTTGWMVYAPTGQYMNGGNNNTGLGFWSNLFQAFGYWYPEKVKGQPSKALAVMFGGTMELTSKIKGADVKPGNRFSIDYGLSQFLSDNLEVGVYGGNNWQVAEDKGSQVYWDASVKDRLSVVGFQLGYFIWTNRLEAVAKYGWNYGAVQRFEQSTYMLNLIFITNALTGNKQAKTK
jgi:hypothetical protein